MTHPRTLAPSISTVAPTPWFATAAADGSFTIEGVPAGRHRLRTWNEKLRDSEHAIDVPASGDVSVELSLLLD